MPGNYYIPALYNTAMKIYVLSYTHFIDFIFNLIHSYFECSIRVYYVVTVRIGNVLLESIHLTYSQLFISCMCALLLQELDLLQYLIVFANGMYISLLVRATQGVTNFKNIDFTLDFSCL